MLSLLLAMQQADTAFPSGAFAFSQGIEGLASLPPGLDAKQLRSHVEATLRHRWVGSDRIALLQAYRANGNIEQLSHVDRCVEAASLAEPLRNGSRRAGRAFLASHARLGTPRAAELRSTINAGDMFGHLVTVQGCVWQGLGLSEEQAAAASGYTTITGLVSAAVRLGRVGAIEGQAVVTNTLGLLAELIRLPVGSAGDDIELQSFVPLIEIATMRQSAAETRLFAN